MTASGSRATRQLVTGLIGRELRREERPAGTFGDLGQQEVLPATTADRSVLGGMNDRTFRCEHAIADARGLTRTDLPELNRSLRRNINNARSYYPPIELAARRRTERERLRVQGTAVPTSVPIPIQDGDAWIGVGTREELSITTESGLPATFTFAEAVPDQIPDDGLVGPVVSASCLSRRVSAA